MIGLLSRYRWIAVVAAALAAGAGITWWGLSPRIQIQADRAARAEQASADAQAMIDLQAGVLAQQQAQIGAITDIARRMRLLGQAINQNAAAQSAALEELKRNDQAVADYLRGAVPAALGRLYQRPETTDPAAYHSPDPMPTDSVPPAGSGAAGGQ